MAEKKKDIIIANLNLLKYVTYMEKKKINNSERESKKNGDPNQRKSSFTLFREKYPNGYAGGCEIVNMKAVLK